jgi:hypothetical protein
MNWNSMLCLVQKIIVSKRYLKLIVLFGWYVRNKALYGNTRMRQSFLHWEWNIAGIAVG